MSKIRKWVDKVFFKAFGIKTVSNLMAYSLMIRVKIAAYSGKKRLF
jgi:hypothetical protein